MLIPIPEPFWADAQILKGEEHDAEWSLLVAERPFYADYEARTTRVIPLVRLVENRLYAP